MSKTVGIAIIAKNESAMIGRALESVKSADEIVVVDTGSADNTIEIARRYTGRVYSDFTWNDSFCDARNHVLRKMTTEWVLSLDCDEYVHDFSRVREAIEQAAVAVDCRLYAADNNKLHYFPRLFRNDPGIFWVGAIHNYVNVIGERVGNVEITYGYSPAHNLDPDRSLRILLKEAGKPGGVRERFYLGREFHSRRRYEECVKVLGRYVQESNYPAEKADAFFVMALSYYRMGDMDSARDACAQCLIINCDWWQPLELMAMLAGDGRGVERWQVNADRWNALAKMATNQNVLFLEPPPKQAERELALSSK